MHRAFDTEKPRIVPRRLSLSLSRRTPRYWLADDIVSTHLFNALSITFPRGEQGFVDSVRNYKDAIEDPALAKEVRAFITQEMHHSRTHADFNDWLRTLGLPVDRIDADVEQETARFQASFSPEYLLAATCALEHFTALLAYALLRSPDMLESMHEDVRVLWLWHAIEETEHKAVAYDVFAHVKGRYGVRVATMLVMSVLFTYKTSLHLADIFKDEARRPTLVERLVSANRLFGPRGLLRGLGGRYLDYLRPSFHPWQHDDRAMLEAAYQRLAEELARKERPGQVSQAA